MYFKPWSYGIKPNVERWQQIQESAELKWPRHVLSECHCCKSSPSFFSAAPLQPCDHLWGHLPFTGAWRSRSSTSTPTATGMPSLERPPTHPPLSWSHRHCPFPSFQQLLWAPGSCQKSFPSQSPTGASQSRPRKEAARDGAQPMWRAHHSALPGGKTHSESMHVSIFNLCGRKRGAELPLLKQWLNITQSMCVALSAAGRAQVTHTCTQHCSAWMTKDVLAAPQIHTFKNQAYMCTSLAVMHADMCTYAQRNSGICSHSYA